MTYLTFNDVEIYKKSPYTLLITLLSVDEKTDKYTVEVEKLSPDSNWHLMLPTEDYLKEAESLGVDVSFWKPYRKWQKRKTYTKEEFDKIFTISTKIV